MTAAAGSSRMPILIHILYKTPNGMLYDKGSEVVDTMDYTNLYLKYPKGRVGGSSKEDNVPKIKSN